MKSNDPQALIDQSILRRIPLETLLLSLILGCVVLAVWDVLTASLFFAGGLLSSLGFIWLRTMVSRVSFHSKKKSLLPLISLYFLRLILIIGIFFIIILFFSEKGIAFAAGFTVIIIVFLAEAGRAISKSKQWKN